MNSSKKKCLEENSSVFLFPNCGHSNYFYATCQMFLEHTVSYTFYVCIKAVFEYTVVHP